MIQYDDYEIDGEVAYLLRNGKRVDEIDLHGVLEMHLEELEGQLLERVEVVNA